MQIALTIGFMALIGAFIGGLTNQIAIWMLFRPHEAKYIGSYRLPFTPGLIPKRRGELATQLGVMVKEHLITPDMLKENIITPEAKEKSTDFLVGMANEYVFDSERTIHEWLGAVDRDTMYREVEQKAATFTKQKIQNGLSMLSTGSIADAVPDRWMTEIDGKVEHVPDYLLKRAETFVNSPEGRAALQKLLNNFLESKGSFGMMVQSLFGDSDKVIVKMENEALKFIYAKETKQLLEDIVSREWQALKDRPMSDVLKQIDWEDVQQSAMNYVARQVQLEQRLDYPIHHFWPDGKEWFATVGAPKVTDMLFDFLEKRFEQLIHSLNIDKMVEKQVNDFPIAKLEGLVIQIATRELKMITVLGALLGGTIGVVQGVIALFIA